GGDPPDRGEVLARVIANVGIEVRPDRQSAGVAEPDGVAVGIGLRERAGADSAAGAGAVVDDDLLAERLAELVADGADDDGGAAAGREGNDERDRPGRIVLRRRWHGFGEHGR